ncbi:MAG TPA: asparagine synthase-related protein, partial [Actinomycetota bacterium]
APARMRGTFAGVVTDGRQAWGFRDHLGYRTLFHHDGPRGVTFASEAKQVVAAAGIPREPDLAALEQVLFGNLTDDTPSAFKGVARLPKSSILHVDAERVRVGRFWHPERLLETGSYTDDELQERFDALMAQASARTLIGTDAVSLSGGIDSPAIAAYAAPEFRRRFGRAMPALSAVFPESPSVDETPYIEAVAEHLGMELHTYRRRAPILEDLRAWVELVDGPVPVFIWPDALTHYRTARDLGIRNLLNGAVAELVMDMRRHLLAHLIRAGRLGAAGRELRRQVDRGVGARAYARQVANAFMPRSVHQARLRRRPPKHGDRVPPWLDVAKVNELAVAKAPSGRERWRYNQLGGFIGPGLSVEANEVAQHVTGVRARYPWADVDLWEFFLSIPAEDKFPDPGISKSLVRRLLRGRVPDVILDRTDKTVFNEDFLSRADYAGLRPWLVDPPERIPGVDYALLKERIEAEDMGVFEYIWAKDLACAHAFLDLFR